MAEYEKSGIRYHTEYRQKALMGYYLNGDYTMKKQEKAIHTSWYQGRDLVEVLHYAIIYGKTYAEIRFQDGRRHTVPASELTSSQNEVSHA